MAVWGSTTTAMFSLGSLLFTESMPQVKESQSMDQQYFKEKIPRPLSATIPLSKAFSPCSSLAGLFGISLERMSLL
jgi:hypothetical protein